MPERLRTYFRLFSDQPPLFRALCLARGQPREPAMHWAKDWHYRGALTHSFGRIIDQNRAILPPLARRVEARGPRCVDAPDKNETSIMELRNVAASSPLIPFSRTINNRQIH